MILMGSHYWYTNTETSDNDYIEYVMPTRDDLFSCTMKSKCIVNPNGDDYNYKDIRMLLKEIGKGSLLSFQILYNEDLCEDENVNKCLKFIRSHRDELYKEFKYNIMRAVYGESIGFINKLKKDSSLTDSKRLKLISNVFRLKRILDYMVEGNNPFTSWRAEDYTKVLDIRNGNTVADFKMMTNLEEGLNSLKFGEKVSLQKSEIYLTVRDFIRDKVFDVI